MTAPVTTPRADDIAKDLLRDARGFAEAKESALRSRQIEALARAVARHLAALEDRMVNGWPLLPEGSARPARAETRMLIIQRWDRPGIESVAEGEIRRGADIDPDGRTSSAASGVLAWALCDGIAWAGRVPYVRKSPDSPWGVRVDILGERV